MKTNISKEQVISLTRSSQSSFNASISLYQLDSNNNTYSNYNVYTMNKELVDTRYVDNVLVFQISFSNPINYLINHIYLDFEVSSETGHALYSLHTFNSSNRTYQNISSERLGYLESIVIDNIQYARIDLSKYFLENNLYLNNTEYFVLRNQSIELIDSLSIYSELSTHKPKLTFVYEDDTYNSLYYNNDKSFLKLDNSNAGTVKTNIKNGIYTVYKNIDEYNGNLNPLSIGLIYNSFYYNTSLISSSINTSLPNGWKFDVMEYLIYNSQNNTYYYYDNLYNKHLFVLPINSLDNDIYFDNGGSGLILYINENDKVIKDEIGNELHFNSNGYITSKVLIFNQRTITITYTYEYNSTLGYTVLKSLTHSRNNKTINFYYETTQNRIRINTSFGNSYINYSSNLLVSLQDKCNNTCTFTYQNGKIEKINDEINNAILFCYCINNRLSSLEVIANNTNTINEYTFLYYQLETKLIDYKNNCLSYKFNDNGLIDSVYEEKNNQSYNLYNNDLDYTRYSIYNKSIPKSFTFDEENKEKIVSLNDTISVSSTNYKILGGTDKIVLFHMELDYTSYSYKVEEDIDVLKVEFISSNNIVIDTLKLSNFNRNELIIDKKIELDSQRLLIRFTFSNTYGSVTIKNVTGTECSFIKSEDMISIDTGATPVLINNINFYNIKDLNKIVYDTTNIISNIEESLNDYKRNLMELNKGNAYFFFNNKQGLVINYQALCLYYSSTISRAFNNSLKLGTIVTTYLNGDIDSQEISYLSYSQNNYYLYDCSVLDGILNVNRQSLTTNFVLTKEEINYSNNDKVIDYSYDVYGNLIYKKEEALIGIYTKSFEQAFEYSNDFMQKIKDVIVKTSMEMVETEYTYSSNTNLTKLTYPNQLEINYYRSNNQLSKISTIVNNITNKNEFSYTNSRINNISHNSINNNYLYDDYNNLSNYKINNSNIFTFNYIHTTSYDIETKNYINGINIKKTCDEYGREVSIELLNNEAIKKKINIIYNDGLINDSIEDLITNPFDSRLERSSQSKAYRVYEYYYDNQNEVVENIYDYEYSGDKIANVYKTNLDNLVRITLQENTFDNYNRLTIAHYYGSNYSYTGNYSYLKQYSKNTEIINSESIYDNNGSFYASLSRQIDKFDRLESETYYYGTNSIVITKNYIYQDYSEEENSENDSSDYLRTSNNIIYFGNSNINYNYDYDIMNNIISETSYLYTTNFNETKHKSYEYDTLNRLVRENNEYLNQTIVYSYDAGGNIIEKKIYSYSTSSLPSSYTTISYNYDSSYKDKLVSFNGDNVNYDSNLNIISIGSNNYTYDFGKKLSSYSYNNILKNRYYYDGFGRRNLKIDVINNINHYYEYDQENRLVYEKIEDSNNTNILKYFYNSKEIIGFSYNNDNYYFEKNALGDIIYIYKYISSSDSKIYTCKYVYNAYGEVKVYDSNNQLNTSDTFIGNINPFRYKGYYYDKETKLYYLNSRYYNPEIGRFMSIDDIDYLEPETINGMNLYAYCNDNPIMGYDPNGNYWDTVFDVLFIGWDIYNLISNDGYVDWKNWIALGVDIAFAVIPFVTGGGGQVCKLSNVADDISDFSKVTVVGESMSRVQTVSQFLNATDNLYNGFKAYDRLSDLGKSGKVLAEIGGKTSNVAWLYGKLRSGYRVIDIGIDTARTIRSSSYIAERITISIWKTRNIWKWVYHLYF